MLIDPDAGSYLDLRRLHSAASKNNIHIILDIALNHCCTNNPIYKDAFTNENSEFKDWFKRDSHGNISFWYGFDDMPEFNQFNEDYQNYVFGDGGVIEKLSKYCDGFTVQELAREYGFAYNTVKLRISKVREKIVDILFNS